MIDIKKLRRLAEQNLDVTKGDPITLIRIEATTVLELLNGFELSQADNSILRAVQVVWKEERAKLVDVLKDARRVLKSGIFENTPFASYSEAWSDMRDAVDACSDIETPISTEEFDKKFESGEDISEHLITEKKDG